MAGSMESTAIIKALGTWIDLGILKEEGEDVYRLLNTAEEGDQGHRPSTRPGKHQSVRRVSLL